ncbi:polyphosphate kinase 1 [Compostibacter hankyongensis]|uniref:Polyphosphate kinase n=1 Tax=Compostibacter hankyongensis TaxID=1007089 RepID=A0ABP8GBK2_9BACT
MDTRYFQRDASWLSFNGRVLQEARNKDLPLMERVKFLSVFSSNLDEFYRVRMPVLMALKDIDAYPFDQDTLDKVNGMIAAQQQLFGRILREELIPAFREKNIHILYDVPLPVAVHRQARSYFFSRIAAFMTVADLVNGAPVFPRNNQLYMVVRTGRENGSEGLFLVTVPSGELPRFFAAKDKGNVYVLFIEDIIRLCLPALLPGEHIQGIYNIKVTRDAELDLRDEYAGDLAGKIAARIAVRDLGLATRFLYQPGIPLRTLLWVTETLQLSGAGMIEGGAYHHLRDLSSLPLDDAALFERPWPPAGPPQEEAPFLLHRLLGGDMMLHSPYQSYDTILRFFNEAAQLPEVEAVYVTLYRIARESRIAQALMTAALNGKSVTVFVELKARFDEANNLKWAKKMKEAGVRIIYSIPGLKVHAKVALLTLRSAGQQKFIGLLGTGNLNEDTAAFYTDHILLTARQPMLQELYGLFGFLTLRERPEAATSLRFEHLIVAQFNLKERFDALIDREIRHARNGGEGRITVKLNNLEERSLIDRLYAASAAGVKIRLIVRSICCLMPGVPGLSDNITVTRIVDRYLEHGRIFCFHNNGTEELYLGSADWMNRNIHHRIEVCFPVHDEAIKSGLKQILKLQLSDNVQAVYIDEGLNNIPVGADDGAPRIRAQEAISRLLHSPQEKLLTHV